MTYLATDTNLDHKVAVKEYMPTWAVSRTPDNSLVPLSDTAREDFDLGVSNFLREARTLVKFRHPNIVRVMTVFEANNTAYLVMEYEEGEEFKSYVQRGAGTDEASLKSLILRIVDGLDQVHQTGFLHRDIKPVNLIIRNDGSPVLLDFGAARAADGDGAHTAYVSAGYTPIEQYQTGDGMEVGPWTDIYSLGATLYYAISGTTPVGPTARLAALVRKSPDPLEPALSVGAGRYSQSFLEAIDWALSFRPNDRPRNLSEWRNELENGEIQPENLLTRASMENESSDRRYDTTSPVPTRQSSRTASSVLAKKQRERQVPILRWAFALGSLLAVLLVGSVFYNDSQKRSELNTLMQQAENKFDRGDYSNGAVPLYREVLASYPDNREAKSRLSQIEQIIARRTDSEIDSGEYAQAEASIRELGQINSDATTALQQKLERVRQLDQQDQALEQQFVKAQSLVATGANQQALSLLDTLRAERPDDPRISQIETQARSAINDNNAREEQIRQQIRQQQQQQQREKERIEKAEIERIRKARERRQKLLRNYNKYLSNAKVALEEGDIKTARIWLDDARSLQIDDDRLGELEAQVVAQETYQRKPLSDYEVSFATGQFNALRRAVESKNQQAIGSLTDGSPSRQNLFDTLFNRYTRLNAKIVDVQPAIDPKRVTAKLRIEAMIMPNGDIVYPSPAYRDSELTLRRERYGWSQIIW